MTDYKHCTSKPVKQQPKEESLFEAVLTGIGFLGCLAASWAVLALVSFN